MSREEKKQKRRKQKEERRDLWSAPDPRGADRARLETPEGQGVPLAPAVLRAEGQELILDLGAQPLLRQRGTLLWLPRLRMVLVRTKSRTVALCTTCPHKPEDDYRIRLLSRGERPRFHCGAHGWCFDRKGRPDNDEARRRLRRYDVAEEGDTLRVSLAPPR